MRGEGAGEAQKGGYDVEGGVGERGREEAGEESGVVCFDSVRYRCCCGACMRAREYMRCLKWWLQTYLVRNPYWAVCASFCSLTE